MGTAATGEGSDGGEERRWSRRAGCYLVIVATTLTVLVVAIGRART